MNDSLNNSGYTLPELLLTLALTALLILAEVMAGVSISRPGNWRATPTS
ncbi:MAG: prepilin-type N-terminal cleavage/methylation domain-containing protein [Sodalis sp. (in: enterobacteria)]